jgi:microcystin-dependent protein
MPFGFAPRGWAMCNGQLLPINQNQALFSLLGTNFGGDGRTTFALPNLQGRTPIHFGPGYVLGNAGGEQTHVLTVSEQPAHTHGAQGTATAADDVVPSGNYLGGAAGMYGPLANTTALHASTIGNAGQNRAHDNMQPYLALMFCIALQGAYPTPN